ncbi:MAG TPA: cupin domain-containing protein [Pseudonocardia sp.]|nr:cupin domain-containing protein [Pseudonocardia sp.]
MLLLQVPGTELTGFFKGASRLGDALDDPKEAERFVDWAAEEYGVQFLDPSVYPPGQSVIDPRAERPASRGNLALPAVEHVITNKTIKSSGERRVKSRFAADPANGPEWIFHLSGTQTGGGVGLIEIIWPAGDTTPFHTHSTEDRAFYVVEGSLDIVLEDSELNLGAGQLGWVPRFTRHAYRVGSEGARVLMSYYPGTSLDRLFELTASIEGITSSPENFEQWAAWAADNFGVLFEQPTSAGDGAAASEAALATGRG